MRTFFSKKKSIHPQLKKQLKRVYGEDVPQDSTFRKLLDHIDEAYFHQSESADAQVEKHDSFLEGALQHISEAVVVTESSTTNGKFSIVYTNQAFSDLTVFSQEEIIGYDPRALIGGTTEPSVVV